MKGKIWILYTIINSSILIIFPGILHQPLNIGSYLEIFLIGWCGAFFLVKNRPSVLSLNSGKETEAKINE